MSLRISFIRVQPVLVWDDGEEFTPGPELQPINFPLSKLKEYLEKLPKEVEILEAKLLEEESDPKPGE